MKNGLASLAVNVLGIALGVIIGLFGFNYIQRVRSAPHFVATNVVAKLKGLDVAPPFIIVKAGCPYCEAAEKFVGENRINVRYLRLEDKQDNTKAVMDALGTDMFPTLVLKDRMLSGFDKDLYEGAKAEMAIGSVATVGAGDP